MPTCLLAAGLFWGLASGCVFDRSGLPADGEPDSSTSVCGDGVLGSGEGCDDGNQVDGDGCDPSCQREAGWVCTGEPSVCEYLCGNGLLDPGEACEGDDLGGASCDSIPGGYTGGTLACTGSCGFDTTGCILPGCGDGVVGVGEECDDGNGANDDDCLTNCRSATCGDGYIWAGHEGCDDGNSINLDGCLNDCTPATCGDGYRWTGQEDCDDGNLLPGDGCDASCQVETGWDCTSGPCEPICGDGLALGSESCDDGNLLPGDGCNASCQVETGWDCSSGSCEPICGDGLILGDEECDDDNTGGGDGCSPSCTLEGYYACDGEPSVCSCVVYVNAASVSSGPDGSSWANAYPSLQDGIDEAESRASSPGDYCAVWVRHGTYETSEPFYLATRVGLFGGFGGSETALSQRDYVNNVTTLDGLNQADSVVVADDVSDARLDGFHVVDGLGSNYGGGLWLQGTGLVVAGCVIRDHTTGVNGGGIYITTDSTVTVLRTWVLNNHAGANGGGIYVRGAAEVAVQDSLFVGNSAGAFGGAMMVSDSGSSLSVINCTVVDNTAGAGGAALRTDVNATLETTNSILWFNESSPVSTGSGSTTISYSNVQGGYPGDHNIQQMPLFVDRPGGNYDLSGSSPGIDAALGDLASSRDILGRGRIDAPAVPNTGSGAPPFVDMGAFEYHP